MVRRSKAQRMQLKITKATKSNQGNKGSGGNGGRQDDCMCAFAVGRRLEMPTFQFGHEPGKSDAALEVLTALATCPDLRHATMLVNVLIRSLEMIFTARFGSQHRSHKTTEPQALERLVSKPKPPFEALENCVEFLAFDTVNLLFLLATFVTPSGGICTCM